MVSFQGLIKDAAGKPVDGPVDLEFRIYDAQADGDLVDMDGDGVIEDTIGEDAKQVLVTSVSRGIVSTKFGPVSPSAFDGTPRWLQVHVNGAALPRIEMPTAPATAEQLNAIGTGRAVLTTDGEGHVQVEEEMIHKGFAFVHEGPDFVMRYAPRGDGGRALVHAASDRLIINYAGDFGDVAVHSDLRCTGTFRANVVRANVVEILGADVAEKFPVSDQVKPGMVVEIDPEQPGKLRLSRTAYSRRVAGVVSGANGLSAGAVLGNLPGHKYAPAIALSGRFYCWADASFGAIVPGDRLTTSSTPGHAMKVTDDNRASGTVIGKAMSSLPEGRGLLLVLVQPQ